ncbi:MAG: BNR-repeat neuraminidase N-terminal domain-containing protein [Ignavibacteriaceae bacterium]
MKTLKTTSNKSFTKSYMIYLLLFLCVFILKYDDLHAQTITIGSGTNTSYACPITAWSAYSYSQQIYTKPQINTSGTIYDISFYYASGAISNSNTWVIYMGHTTKTSFSSGSDWISVAGLTQVFSGTVTAPGSAGWMRITLTTPFAYNNSDNLVIAVDENSPSQDMGAEWRVFTSGDNTAIYYSDMADVNPASPSPYGSTGSDINQIQLNFTAPVDMVYSSSTTEQATTSYVMQGGPDSKIIRLKVTTDGVLNPLNLTSVTFNTAGSTSAADISNANVYYTTNTTFSTGTPFGSTVTNPSGEITFTGSKSLVTGDNYFWLAYDIAAGATLGNLVDGTCTSFIVGGGTQTPAITSPPGSRQIVTGVSADMPSGAGTSGDPYLIATLNNLYWLTQNSGSWVTGKYYKQTANIDASTSSGWDEANGFTPIGNVSNNFSGNYDGQNYTVSGIYINRSASDNQGMFGYINGGSVQNLGLLNVNITGKEYVGALAGSWYSPSANIINCYSSGSVNGEGDTGGLIGSFGGGDTVQYCYSSCNINASGYSSGGLFGSIYNNGYVTIEYCYSTGNVSTSGNNAGGFVGLFNNPNSFIRYCYSTGSVTCSGDRAGGFAGVLTTSYINISNCYSLGNVTRSSGTETNFGGFIGYSGGSYTTINYCYSAGSVNFGTSYGFIGYHTNETANVYTSNFFDAQTSGQSSGIGATGKTTTEMKTQSTFTNAGWNFSTYWQMIGTNYPDLQGNSNPALPVELTSFSAQVEKPNVVNLTWATATEVNNYGFEVERTEWMNGCMNEWKQIGFVQGSGNSNAPKSYSFKDNTPRIGKVLYRLKQIDNDGTVSYSQIVEVEVNSLPTEFTLSQNYPNPFNPSTVISYQLPLNSFVTLELFAVTGEKVGTLINGEQEAGYYNFELNSAKFSLTSGIYFYRLIAGNYSTTRKLILLR